MSDSDTSFNDVSPSGSNLSNMRIHPPTLALGLLVGTFLLHALIEDGHARAHQFLGLLLVSGGVGLCFYAAAIFQARDTTKKPWGEPTDFVKQMPYTFTRNPMYLGVTIALLGFAAFFGSPVMVLAPIAFFLAIDRMTIPNEEATMERLFGQQYTDYTERVRRWL